MNLRRAPRSGQTLADNTPQGVCRLAHLSTRRRVGGTVRLTKICLHCLTQYQDPSFDGQQASPSATLPVFFGLCSGQTSRHSRQHDMQTPSRNARRVSAAFWGGSVGWPARSIGKWGGKTTAGKIAKDLGAGRVRVPVGTVADGHQALSITCAGAV